MRVASLLLLACEVSGYRPGGLAVHHSVAAKSEQLRTAPVTMINLFGNNGAPLPAKLLAHTSPRLCAGKRAARIAYPMAVGARSHSALAALAALYRFICRIVDNPIIS